MQKTAKIHTFFLKKKEATSKYATIDDALLTPVCVWFFIFSLLPILISRKPRFTCLQFVICINFFPHFNPTKWTTSYKSFSVSKINKYFGTVDEIAISDLFLPTPVRHTQFYYGINKYVTIFIGNFKRKNIHVRKYTLRYLRLILCVACIKLQ